LDYPFRIGSTPILHATIELGQPVSITDLSRGVSNHKWDSLILHSDGRWRFNHSGSGSQHFLTLRGRWPCLCAGFGSPLTSQLNHLDLSNLEPRDVMNFPWNCLRDSFLTDLRTPFPTSSLRDYLKSYSNRLCSLAFTTTNQGWSPGLVDSDFFGEGSLDGHCATLENLDVSGGLPLGRGDYRKIAGLAHLENLRFAPLVFSGTVSEVGTDPRSSSLAF
jgi:hypothetical protein